MPDRPSSDGSSQDDAYSWLYEGPPRKPSDERVPDPAPDADPDATRAMPIHPEHQPAPPPPEATRAMPSQPAAQEPSPLPPPQLPPPGSKQRKTPAAGDGAQGGPPPTRPPKPKKRRHPIRRIVIALLLVWLLFMIAVPLWAWSKIDKVDAEPDGERPGEQPGTTYLLVGSDSRAELDAEQQDDLGTGDVGGQRTDTIMLMHVGSGPTLLMSIPRDSIVEVPGYGSTKVNAAFAYGDAELLVETIELNTGIRVDDYVEIGFGGFVDIVDAVGGVEICPKENLNDPKANLKVTKGCQEADGRTALGYARTRAFADSDITRVQNQREVLGSIASEAKSPLTILNPMRYFQLAGSSADSLRIGDNVGPISLGRFAMNLGGAMGDSGLNCTVPIADFAVNWDAERSQALFDLIKADNTDDIDKSLCTESGLPE